MGLTQPFIDGVGAYDASKDITLTLNVLGGDKITSFSYQVFNVANNTVIAIDGDTEIRETVDNDVAGESIRSYSFTIPANQLTNNFSYRIIASTYNKETGETSNGSQNFLFACYATPKFLFSYYNGTEYVELTNNYVVTSPKLSIQLSFDKIDPKSSAQLNTAKLYLYGKTTDGSKKLISQSDELYSTTLTYDIGDFSVDSYQNYEIVAKGETIEGMEFSNSITGITSNIPKISEQEFLNLTNNYKNGSVDINIDFGKLSLYGFSENIENPFSNTYCFDMAYHNGKIYIFSGLKKMTIYDIKNGTFTEPVETPLVSEHSVVVHNKIYCINKSDPAIFYYDIVNGIFNTSPLPTSGAVSIIALRRGSSRGEDIYIAAGNYLVSYSSTTDSAVQIVETPIGNSYISLCEGDNKIYIIPIEHPLSGDSIVSYSLLDYIFENTLTLKRTTHNSLQDRTAIFYNNKIYFSNGEAICIYHIDSNSIETIDAHLQFGTIEYMRRYNNIIMCITYYHLLVFDIETNTIKATTETPYYSSTEDYAGRQLKVTENGDFYNLVGREFTNLYKIYSPYDTQKIEIQYKENSSLNWKTTLLLDYNDYSELQISFYYCGNNRLYDFRVLLYNSLEQVVASVEQTVLSCFNKNYICDSNTIYNITNENHISSASYSNQTAIYEPYGSKYPIIGKNAVLAYQSGSTTAVLLAPTSNTTTSAQLDRFAQVKLVKEFNNWLSNGKPKVLKDFNGNLWLIMTYDAIQNTYYKELGNGLASTSFSWKEVGEFTSEYLKKLGMTNNFKINYIE